MTIVYAIGMGLSMATTALVSRRIGEKNKKEASVVAFQAILLGVISSVLLSIPGVIFAKDFLKIMGATDKMANEGFEYRSSLPLDQTAIAQATRFVTRSLHEFKVNNLIPSEEIGVSNYDRGHRLYGIQHWSEFYNARQLLALSTYVDSLHTVLNEAREELSSERLAPLQTYLAIMVDKVAIYNNRSCRFDPGRGIRSSFDKHNYAFVWLSLIHI